MNFCTLVVLNFILSFSAIAQSIVYVTPSGSGNNSGSSWTNALPGNQLPNRLPVASSGTQFWIAAGTYKPTTTTDRTASFSLASGVSVYGGFTGTESTLDQRVIGTNETILSGDIGTVGYNQDNSIAVLRLTNVGQSIALDGLTVQDGYLIDYSDGSSSGAGLLADLTNTSLSLSISNCRFTNNIVKPSLSGGAVSILIRDNSSCNFLVKNCYFSGNVGGSGGAVCPTTLGGPIISMFEDCVFIDNEGTNSGGAISYRYVNQPPNQPDIISLSIKRCRFITNKAFVEGGAVELGYNKCLLENCLFDSNQVTANYRGGGAVDGSTSNSVLKNCLFLNNSAYYGGAVYSDSHDNSTRLTFINSDFIKNKANISGGVLYSENDNPPNLNETYLTNCILWQNTSPDSPVYKSSSQSNSQYNQLYATYSLIQGGYPGTGNLNADPLFVDPSSGDYRLKPTSPAINAGDPYTANLSTTDLAGNSRLQDGRVDIGAYEFIDSNILFTLKNGAWTDPSVWSCNCIPGITAIARIRHTIQIPDGYTATAGKVDFVLGGKLTFNSGAKIQLD